MCDIHKSSCTISLLPVHAQTHSRCSSCLYCPCPPPLFSFSSLWVCITGSHRRFLVLNRDILAPDSRSLTRCSSCPMILYWAKFRLRGDHPCSSTTMIPTGWVTIAHNAFPQLGHWDRTSSQLSLWFMCLFSCLCISTNHPAYYCFLLLLIRL